MSGNEILGLVMLVLMVGVIFVGFPISFTLLFLGLVFGYFGLGTIVFDLAFFQTIGLMKEQTLAAVPLFIFMGYVVEQAGLMERLFRAFQVMLAPVRGSLYLGVILTATVFAMATGIVGAAVTVLGIMAAPIMMKSGYSPRLSAGAIAAGGTLGILIPPSVMLIVMGPVINVSVAKLYAAAFGPGFLLAGLYIVYTLTRSFLDPTLGPAGAQGGAGHVVRPDRPRVRRRHGAAGAPDHRDARHHPGRRRHADRGGGHGRVGGPPAGDRLSPVHARGPQDRGLQHHDHLQHGPVPRRRLERLRRDLRAARQRHRHHQRAAGLPVPPFVTLLLVMGLIFLLGWPFEWPAIIFVFIPIFYPVIEALKYDMLWFGALVAVNLQTAYLSPPVAMSAYYLKQVVPQWSLGTIYRGMADFMVIQVIALLAVMLFPEIALWFPRWLFDQP